METKEKEIIKRDVEQNILFDGGIQYLKTVGDRIACMVGERLEEGHGFVLDHGSFRILFSSHVERCESYMFIVNKDLKTLVRISVLAGNAFADVGTSDGNDLQDGRKSVLARRAVSDAVCLLAEHSGEMMKTFLKNR